MDPQQEKATQEIADKLFSSDASFTEKMMGLFFLDSNKAEIVLMWFFLMFLIAGFIWLLAAWNRDDSNQIQVSDLICVDGKLNESKMARFGAFVVSTWAFVYLVVTDSMTEWYFMGYMTAWVGNALFSKYMSQKDHVTTGDKPPLSDESEYSEEDTPRRSRRAR